jgi:CBS domain-containing protein
MWRSPTIGGSDRADAAEENVSQVAWAHSSLGDDPDLTIEALQSGLTVGLIATKRADLETCFHDEMLAAVVDRNRRNRFDFLPVLAPGTKQAGVGGRIVGVIEIAPFMSGPAVDEQIHERMRPLSEENLIGADASILAFVRDADRQKCRLVVSGREISGLVTLADLQRLPVRAALFGLVTHLEIIMANAIRREFNGNEAWIDRLPEGRQKLLHEKIDEARKHEDLVDALLFTEFPDKAAIIRKSPLFLNSKSELSKSEFKNEFEDIRSLRDYLAHANDYAASADAASQACRIVRLIDKWSKQLRDWPRPSAKSSKR